MRSDVGGNEIYEKPMVVGAVWMQLVLRLLFHSVTRQSETNGMSLIKVLLSKCSLHRLPAATHPIVHFKVSEQRSATLTELDSYWFLVFSH